MLLAKSAQDQEILMCMVHMWHIYTHTSPTYAVKYWTYMSYIPSLVGIFVFGTYLEITCEVEVQFVMFWHIYAKLLGL